MKRMTLEEMVAAHVVMHGVSLEVSQCWTLVRGRPGGGYPAPKTPLPDDLYELQLAGSGNVVGQWTGSVPLVELLSAVAPRNEWLTLWNEQLAGAQAARQMPSGGIEFFAMLEVVG